MTSTPRPPTDPRSPAGESTRSSPPRTNATRSHSRSASSRLWVARTIVRPDRRSDSIASRTMQADSGSRAAVGSSRKTTAGSWSSARTIASFCFIPLLNVPTARRGDPTARTAAGIARSARHGSWRPCRRAARRSRGWRSPTASRTAPASRSGSRPAPGRPRARSSTSKPSTVARPSRRRDERGQQPDRRRLAGAVRAEEAEDLAAADLEVHAADRPQVAEPPAEPDGAKHHGVGVTGRQSAHRHAVGARACHNRAVTLPGRRPS